MSLKNAKACLVNLRSQCDSQAISDVGSRMQEVEVQLEMQPNRSPHSVEVTEVESQPATETQTEEETRLETQVDEDDGESVCVGHILLTCRLSTGFLVVWFRLVCIIFITSNRRLRSVRSSTLDMICNPCQS